MYVNTMSNANRKTYYSRCYCVDNSNSITDSIFTLIHTSLQSSKIYNVH